MKLAQLRVRTMAPRREPLVKSTILQWTGTTLSACNGDIYTECSKKKPFVFFQNFRNSKYREIDIEKSFAMSKNNLVSRETQIDFSTYIYYLFFQHDVSYTNSFLESSRNKNRKCQEENERIRRGAIVESPS